MIEPLDGPQLAPPAPGLIRKTTFQITPDKKLALARIASSADYSALLDLMEGIVEVAETLHFQAWKDKEQFERTGLVAVAQRQFFERIQQEIKHQVEEFSGELEFARTKKENVERSPEDFVRDNLTK